ncbi:glycosyltransferase [Tardibacter chloracetimidivorans]|nr:glycosyltransferase [Tardibacter chloracetimidivorans]
MASYNGAPYIEDQLRSILASGQVDEVLISDDGSSDDSVDRIRAISDPRVRLVLGPGQGLVRNFEFLLSEARGDYIFLADQDDIWLRGKVSTMMAHLRYADLVVSDCAVVDERLNTITESFFALRRSRNGLMHNIMRNSYLGCCIALRRQLLDYALPFPANVPMHDWWLGLVAETFGRPQFIADRLVLYRRHGGNTSTTSESSATPMLVRLRWRIILAWALARRMILTKVC